MLPGKICKPKDLHNVAVIKLPETRGSENLENIIASMVLYKMQLRGN